MKRLLGRSLPLAGIVLSCAATPSPPAPRALTTPSPSGVEPAKVELPETAAAQRVFDALRERVTRRWLDDYPEYARNLGFHEYDGKVADVSAKSLAARVVAVRAERDELHRATPVSAEDKFDLELMKQGDDVELFDLVELDRPHSSPQFYEPLFEVNSYLDRQSAPIEERAKRLVEHEEAALAQVPRVYENLKHPLSKVIAKTAGKNFEGFAEYLRGDIQKNFGSIGDPEFRARFAKANEALAKEAKKLGQWLATEGVAKGSDSAHVLGKERYKKLLLAQEGITMSLDDFAKMGEDNLLANKAAYEALAPKVKPRRPTAKTYLAEATDVMDRARAFIVDKKLVSLPTDDRALLKETPPYARWNSAFLDASGPFDTTRTAFYYVTLPDPKWPKKEQEEYVPTYGSLVATTVHEVYPGHFLQGRWIERAPTKVQRMSNSYSFTEGWAHYVEQMMLEEGFLASDEVRLGQLEDALLRNCRFVVSVGIHTKGISVADAERRFMNDCHIGKAEARQQAARGTFDPGYFAYTLGKLQILALRDEAKKKLGARFSLQRFHDALLAHGTAPVELLRPRVLADLEKP